MGQFSRNTVCRRCGHPKPGPGEVSAPITADASPLDVENFLLANMVNDQAAQQFREMPPDKQRVVMNRGSLADSRDPTAVLISRMVAIKKAQKNICLAGGQDWTCPGCWDIQFARNTQCRQCGTPNPALTAGGGGGSSAMVGPNDWAAQQSPGGKGGKGGAQMQWPESWGGFFDSSNNWVDIEAYIRKYFIEDRAADQLREMDPAQQKMWSRAGPWMMHATPQRSLSRASQRLGKKPGLT